jgi:hypothetical protein
MGLRDFRVNARWLLEAAGAALLFLLPDFSPLVVPGNLAIYHHYLPITNLVGGLLLSLFGAFAAATALIVLCSRLPLPARRIVGTGLAGVVCWRAISVLYNLFGVWLENVGLATGISGAVFFWEVARFWNKWAHLSAYGFILLFLLLAWFMPAVSRRAVRAVRLNLAAFAFCAVWIVPNLFEAGLVRPVAEVPAQTRSQPQDSAQSRVIWVLFDELSYDLLFDHHPTGLPTPNFDHLRSQSVSFDNLQPVGFFTNRVVPSLLAGFRIKKIASTSDGRLRYRDERDHRLRLYDPQQTLFALAQAKGWNPAVAGWYIPYCRTFAPVLSQCSWATSFGADLPMERHGASESRSAFSNALVLPEAPFERVSRTALLEENTRDFLQVMDNAKRYILDGKARFVYIHLPVPHPPGFYNRRTHQLSLGGNYFDNLVLADDTLGLLRHKIDATPWAAQTTLIVSSDHSWRVPFWRNQSGWTAEEEKISKGRFDPRPVFLVHFPGEENSRDIGAAVPELIEHEIIAGMLTGEIRDLDDLATRQVLPGPAE